MVWIEDENELFVGQLECSVDLAGLRARDIDQLEPHGTVPARQVAEPWVARIVEQVGSVRVVIRAQAASVFSNMSSGSPGELVVKMATVIPGWAGGGRVSP